VRRRVTSGARQAAAGAPGCYQVTGLCAGLAPGFGTGLAVLGRGGLQGAGRGMEEKLGR
jgi:hypothetical protein